MHGWYFYPNQSRQAYGEHEDNLLNITPFDGLIGYCCADNCCAINHNLPSLLRPLTCTAWTGKLPAAVSPDNMTQSVPSSTALATSVASARVGRGFLIMLSSICVAVITGLPTCMCTIQCRKDPATLNGQLFMSCLLLVLRSSAMAINKAMMTDQAPTMLQDWIIIFCARKIFSVGISMPRSPRATMMASLFSRMSLKFCRPS